jgi:hypothetical protein
VDLEDAVEAAGDLWGEVQSTLRGYFLEAGVLPDRADTMLAAAHPHTGSGGADAIAGWRAAVAWQLPLRVEAGGPAAVPAPVVPDPWLHAATADAAAHFAAHGYVQLSGLLPAPYFTALVERHRRIFMDRSSALAASTRVEYDGHLKRHTAWNEGLSQFVSLRLQPVISALVGTGVSSIYTYSIHYTTGGVLYPHVDRPQNTFSVSLNLGLEDPGAPAWPLHVCPAGTNASSGACVPIIMAPNDALLYRGVEHVHFRHPLEAGTSMQVIFGFRDPAPAHCNSQ